MFCLNFADHFQGERTLVPSRSAVTDPTWREPHVVESSVARYISYLVIILRMLTLCSIITIIGGLEQTLTCLVVSVVNRSMLELAMDLTNSVL